MPARCPLHIVTGKGGVGKTTVALALAHALAADGATVVVAEVEGRGGLALATGVEVGAEPGLLFEVGLDKLDQRNQGRDTLDQRANETLDQRFFNLLFGRPSRPRAGRVEGVQIDPRASLGGYLQRHYRLGFAADVLQVEPLVDFATRIAPGLRDILLIGQVTHLTETHPEIDALVLDAPPSGRIGSFLGAGSALAELTDGSPIATQAASVMDDLRDPGCRTHVVTLLDELPVSEAIETVQAVRDLGLGLGSVIANRCLTPLDLPEPPPAPAGITATDWALITGSVTAENERARAQTAWQALLEHRTGLPLVRLPELPAALPAHDQSAHAQAVELARLLGRL